LRVRRGTSIGLRGAVAGHVGGGSGGGGRQRPGRARRRPQRHGVATARPARRRTTRSARARRRRSGERTSPFAGIVGLLRFGGQAAAFVHVVRRLLSLVVTQADADDRRLFRPRVYPPNRNAL